jgi:hypothetical protein
MSGRLIIALFYEEANWKLFVFILRKTPNFPFKINVYWGKLRASFENSLVKTIGLESEKLNSSDYKSG